MGEQRTLVAPKESITPRLLLLAAIRDARDVPLPSTTCTIDRKPLALYIAVLLSQPSPHLAHPPLSTESRQLTSSHLDSIALQ